MATWENELLKAIGKAAGTRFSRRGAITSSTILLTTATALGNAATGRLKILSINIQSDATGLAGGTNFVIKRGGGTIGTATLLSTSVASLGVSLTIDTDNSAAALGGIQPTVANNLPCVLEPGDTLTFNNTVAAGTGAGVAVVTVQFERIDANADMTFAIA